MKKKTVTIKPPKKIKEKNDGKKTELKKEKDNCPCCDNNYNNSFRKELKCPYCPWISCNMCCRQYILTKANPQCMGCKTIWPDDFLFSVFPKTWVDNDLRDHLDDVLVQQEKSLIPLAVVEIEKEKIERKHKTIQQQRIQLERMLDRINQQILKINSTPIPLLPYQKLDLEIKCKEQKEIERNYNEILLLETELSIQIGKPIRTRFRRPCPDFKCKGYIDIQKTVESDSNIDQIGFLHCSVCNKDFCSRCRENTSKDKDKCKDKHVCDETVVKTLKLLDSDTKSCPGCKVSVYKIEGCNQMFCTNCNTAFNWDTGEIETGRIHNPHYFEWLSKNSQPDENRGENRGEIEGRNEARARNGLQLVDPCGRPVDNLTQKINSVLTERYPDITYIENAIPFHHCKSFINSIIRIVHHIRSVETPVLQDPTVRHLKFRIRYVLNELKEDHWKHEISIQERNHKKKFMLGQIMDTVYTIFSDILHKFLNDTTPITFVPFHYHDFTNVPEIYVECENARQYFNDISRRHSLRFNLTDYRYITDEYYFTNKPTVKEESPIENYSIIYKSKLAVLDWMDDTEKEAIHTFKSISESCISFLVLLESITQKINENQKYSDLYSSLESLYKSIYSNNISYLHDLEEKIKIRKRRKIRINILTHAINFGQSKLSFLSSTLYTNLTVMRHIEKFTTTFNHPIIGELIISINIFPFITHYIFLTKFEQSIPNTTIYSMVNTWNKFSSICKNTFICKRKEDNNEFTHFHLLDILLAGFIYHHYLYQFNYISKAIYQLYYNIQPIRYSPYYSNECNLQIKLTFKHIIDDLTQQSTLLDRTTSNLLQKIKYWTNIDS